MTAAPAGIPMELAEPSHPGQVPLEVERCLSSRNRSPWGPCSWPSVPSWWCAAWPVRSFRRGTTPGATPGSWTPSSGTPSPGWSIVFPAVLIPSLASPWLGLATGSLAAFTAVASFVWSPRVLAWQEERLHRAATHQELEAAAARHRTVLARWQRYELDPACCIDFPAMTDVRRPETAALIKAMKEAERLRAVDPRGTFPPSPGWNMPWVGRKPQQASRPFESP